MHQLFCFLIVNCSILVSRLHQYSDVIILICTSCSFLRAYLLLQASTYLYIQNTQHTRRATPHLSVCACGWKPRSMPCLGWPAACAWVVCVGVSVWMDTWTGLDIDVRVQPSISYTHMQQPRACARTIKGDDRMDPPTALPVCTPRCRRRCLLAVDRARSLDASNPVACGVSCCRRVTWPPPMTPMPIDEAVSVSCSRCPGCCCCCWPRRPLI